MARRMAPDPSEDDEEETLKKEMTLTLLLPWLLRYSLSLGACDMRRTEG